MKITDEKLLELWEESKRTLGSGWTDPIKFARMVLEAAAPDVKDEPVAYALFWSAGDLCRLTANKREASIWLNRVHDNFDGDAVPTAFVSELYACPSPRIAELEAEVVKLQARTHEVSRNEN